MNGDIPPPPAGYGPDTSAMPPPPAGYGPTQQPQLTAQHLPTAFVQPVPSHGPEPGDGWLSRGLEAGGQREVQTVQGQAQALYQQPTLGMGVDTGTPEEIRQNITGPVPHWSSAALSRLKAGDPVGAAVAFAMDNVDKIQQLPEWAQNIILGKKIPESIGQGAIDVWNQVGAMAYGGAHPIDAVPATEAAVRSAARGAEAARQGIPAVGASAGAWMGGKMGSAARGPGAVVGGAVGAYLGKRAGAALRDVLPPVPGTEFGLPPAIDWSAFERTEPPSGPLGPPPPPPPPPSGGGPPLATPEQLAAIRQQFEDIRARGQEAPAAETPAEAPAAAATGDELAREYGYKNEQAAIDDVGRAAWQMTKAQGRAAGRPVGAPPPIAEPPAAGQPALTQQLRASLAQEPAAEPARDPQVVQAIHDAADKLDDAGMLQTFRAQQEYERQVTELEKGRERYAAEHGEHGTKQMLAAAAGEAPPEQWTKLPNWTAADEQRIDALLASHDIKVSEGQLQPVTQRGQALLDQMQRENAQTAANRAAAAARVAQPYGTPQFSPESEGYGADNKFITQQRYEATKAALDAKIAKINAEGMRAGPPSPAQLAGLMPHYMEIGAYHLEAGLRNFPDWSQQMLKDAGEAVRPYLLPMWNDLQKVPHGTEPGPSPKVVQGATAPLRNARRATP